MTVVHPLEHGQIFFSPGCHFSYRVIGPCCRLFDREQLPWPCCRLQWRSKEPSWRRIGKRFVPDLATKRYPSYSVEILGQGSLAPIVVTLYSEELPPSVKDWWYADRKKHRIEDETVNRAIVEDVARYPGDEPGSGLDNETVTSSMTRLTTSGVAEDRSVEG